MPDEDDQPHLSKASQERREKKAEIRAQKERQAKAYARRQMLRKAVVLGAIALVIAGGVMLISRPGDRTEEASPGTSAVPQSNAELLAGAATAAEKAGCTPVKNVGAFSNEEDGSHDGARAFSEYPSVPPASGPHSEPTVAAGVYDEPVEIGPAIHSLEHGAAHIWYSPDVANATEVAEIAAWVDASPENTDHTIMSPFDYPDEGQAGSLPGKSKLALVAWHNVMLCDRPSLPAVVGFMSGYRYPPVEDKDYLGEAPETGVPI